MGFSDLTTSEGNIDLGNSSTTPLSAGATFTGEWFDTTNFLSLSIFIYSDQDSASLGGKIQFSTDASNIDLEISGTYSGGVGHPVDVPPRARYFRFVFTNGSIDQTEFRLQTIPKRQALTNPSLRIDDHIPEDFTLPVQRNVITGHSTAGGGEYVNVKVNPSGAIVTESNPSAVTSSISGELLVDWNGTELKVGANPLDERKEVTITILSSGHEVYIGYDSDVGPSKCLTHLEHHDTAVISVSNGQSLYASTKNSKMRVTITETAYG